MKRAVAILILCVTIFASGPPCVRAAGLECRHLPALFALCLQLHFATREATEPVKSAAVDQFIKLIDPAKTLFLESEIEPLRAQLRTVFDTTPSSCSALDAVYALVLQRVGEDEEHARKILAAKEFKLDEGTELVLDARSRGRPRTAQERQELLRKLLHFQLANLLLTEIKPAEAVRELTHRYELITRRFKEVVEKGELPNLFARAFATALDPHSAFLSAEDLEDFQIGMRLSLEGIGASLSSNNGFTVIEELIPGGSAAKSNVLRPKDRIIAVAQEGQKAVSVVDMDLRSVVKQIRGKKGTSVKLTILRQGDKTETFDITLVRDKIDIRDAAAKLSYETRSPSGKPLKIAVIELATFYGGSDKQGRSSSADVRNLLYEAAKNGAQGVLLDLSRNGGGMLEEAVKVAGLFIRKGAVVSTQSSDGKRRVQGDDDPEVAWNGPVLVLTSHASASASEILAGALKDYRRAIVVGGHHTFGKGTVQMLCPLSEKLGAVKVTIGMYFLPGGASTQRTGVKPDLEVVSPFNGEDVGESKSENALPSRSTQPFLSTEVNGADPAARWTPVDDPTIAALAGKSRDRVAKDAALAKTKKDLDEGRKKGPVKIADMLKKADKNELKASLKERIKNLEAPFLNECVNIMGDWLAMGRGAPAPTGSPGSTQPRD